MLKRIVNDATLSLMAVRDTPERFLSIADIDARFTDARATALTRDAERQSAIAMADCRVV